MNRIAKTVLAFILLISVVSQYAIADSGQEAKKILLVSRIVDEFRDLHLSYDAENRLVSIRGHMMADDKSLSLDSLIYNSRNQLVYRILEYTSVESGKDYTESISYIYDDNEGMIVIDKTYNNDLLNSARDTIFVNDEGQILSDKYYSYDYDVNENGNTIIEQLTLDVEGESFVSERVKRFEYDDSISPFIYLNLSPWFIVSQFHFFEFVGRNIPKSIIHETISKKNGKVKVMSYDIENMTIEKNEYGYPVLLQGEDDVDGKWETRFEYIEPN